MFGEAVIPIKRQDCTLYALYRTYHCAAGEKKARRGLEDLPSLSRVYRSLGALLAAPRALLDLGPNLAVTG